jgi:hypothetical protein
MCLKSFCVLVASLITTTEAINSKENELFQSINGAESSRVTHSFHCDKLVFGSYGDVIRDISPLKPVCQ